MVNVVVIQVVLLEQIEKEIIRKAILFQDYLNEEKKNNCREINLLPWQKQKSVINTFKEGSIVLIKGRLDYYKEQEVIIVESSEILGKV